MANNYRFKKPVLWLYDFLSLKNDVNVPSKRNHPFLLASWRSLTNKAGSGAGFISQKYGSEDPDPYQTITAPELLKTPWARICKPFKEHRNRFPAWRAGTTTLLVVPARHASNAGGMQSSESIPGLLKRLQRRALVLTWFRNLITTLKVHKNFSKT